MSSFAFVFPGQGSQSIGMLNAWQERHAIVKDTLQEADDALGFNLSGLIRDGQTAELDQTANTQPAMLLADVTIWRVWVAAGGPMPQVMAGHSLGEYAALVAAGSLEFVDALRLVRARGQWMQEAVPNGQGAMAAIVGLDDDAVQTLCLANAGTEVLEPVNYNAPGQVVVAGHKSAVDRLLSIAKDAGARMAVLLPVSVPAHSALMAPVAQRLADALQEVQLKPAAIPVIHNLTGNASRDDLTLAALLSAQVKSPVQWVRTLNTMQTDFQIQAGFECGPGQVLCGLAKRSLKGVPFFSLAQPDAIDKAIDQLVNSDV